MLLSHIRLATVRRPTVLEVMPQSKRGLFRLRLLNVSSTRNFSISFGLRWNISLFHSRNVRWFGAG